MKIDIFSDPVCPWCLVGLTRLDNAIERLENKALINIVHHAFLLDANTPEEGEDVVAMLTRKYGRPPDDMWERLEAEASSSGLALNMRKQKRRNPAQGALILIEAAEKKGTQHALAVDLSRACYLDGLNIADVEVLQNLALAHGFASGEVAELLSAPENFSEIEARAKEALEMGITGVPFFVFNNDFVLSGAQPETLFDDALLKALSEEPMKD